MTKIRPPRYPNGAAGAHRAMRQGDEYFCPICGARWGNNDTPPKKCIKLKLSL